jgi:hypothetical protein
MTRTDDDRDTMGVGQPEEAELAEEELGEESPPPKADVSEEVPEEDRAEEELEPLEGGAETMADLEEEEGERVDRPGPTKNSS